MWLEMKVKQLALDPLSNMPMIILRDAEEKRSLPIWVGLPEANAIALELEKITTARPLTHDLLRNVISDLGANVEYVFVNDLSNDTFYARIMLQVDGRNVEIDSRPSDAIALAVRCDAPIFAADDVVESSAIEMEDEDANPVDPETQIAEFKAFLDDVRPDDFAG